MNKKSSLVSIIIPTYNVEKFVEKCIKSCINQTYKNIEIIVVNDGSTDSSGKIVDQLATTDNRIKVYHKKNEGVSATRNFGISKSNGDYLCFIDADDFYAEDYIEYMLNLVKQTGSDFCMSKNCFIQKGEKQIPENVRKLSSAEASKLLLSMEVEVGCWNKIFKKSLLLDNNIYFSNDLFYGEGLEFIVKASQLSNSVGVGERKVYYYRKNNLNSATTKFNYDKYINGEKSLLRIFEELKFKDKKVINEWNLHYCMFSINALIGVINNRDIEEYMSKYNYWLSRVRKQTKKLIFKNGVSLKDKIKMIICCIIPKVISVKNYRAKIKSIKKSV